MKEIATFIQENWVGWLFIALSTISLNSWRILRKQINLERQKNIALMNGIQALLRQSIIDSHNKYSDRGFCPIYAKESIKKVYHSYHELGGNDVATELYEQLLEMPVKEEKNNV